MLTIIRAIIGAGFAGVGVILGLVLLVTDGVGAGIFAFVLCQFVGAMIVPTVSE